jgi:carbon monoxide dehydrogenase subunit G
LFNFIEKKLNNKVMKYLHKTVLYLLISILLIFTGCSKEDSGYGAPQATVINSKVYNLATVGTLGVSGTATIIEKSDATLSIELKLNNAPMGGSYPAHVHFNTAAEGGNIALTLTAVDGSTGKSTTTFKTLDAGTPITYQTLLSYNGYINIHKSTTELGTLVAQGDIGQNELTGKKMSYGLAQKDVIGINGTVEFAERINQTTLVTIKLSGTRAGGSHPAHIHENNVATSGNIIAGLNPVNGDTGVSMTQIATLVGGAPITYTQFLVRNAYVNVHKSLSEMSTIVAQGNIGLNVGSKEAKTYTVTNSGSTAYVFNGEGLTNSSNPNFTFKRGGTYTFNVNTPGHPFYLNSVQDTGTGNVYSSGVTRNGAVAGVITFTVPMNAPNTLYYNCEFHGSMTGIITITD